MEIIPAIDIIGGRCVRLTGGDFATEKIYSGDPLDIARQFESSGIKRLHLVDLDGARAKTVVNLDVLEKIASGTSLIIDFGGGIRSDEDMVRVFNAGASMITAGSIAVSNKALVAKWLKVYGPSRIILGADVKNRQIAVHGWLDKTNTDVSDLIRDYLRYGLKNVICTDIERDGKMNGPSVDLYLDLKEKFPDIQLIASGGVSSLSDLDELKEAGLWGVIIGKAIYEEKIILEDLKKYLL